MIAKLINDELTYYAVELAKLRDQLESQIGGGKVASNISVAPNLAYLKKAIDAIGGDVDPAVNIGLSKKHIPLLKELYRLAFERGDVVNRDLTSEDEFINILTADDLSTVEGKIYFGCETTQVAYILEKLKGLSGEFTYVKVEKSGKFFTKKRKELTGTDISKARSSSPFPKEYEKIDSFFKF
jgi:hypothetical protein